MRLVRRAASRLMSSCQRRIPRPPAGDFLSPRGGGMHTMVSCSPDGFHRILGNDPVVRDENKLFLLRLRYE